MIAVATKHINVYIDTSAYKAKRYSNEVIAYMKSHGQNKVMFGTNYPIITPEKCLENLKDLHLDSEIENKFLPLNAMKVFKLKI